MRNTVINIFVIILILSLSGCGTSKKSASVNTVDDCHTMSFTNLPLSQIDTDQYTIDSLFIINDCLNIMVSYDGGCGNADFELFFTDIVMESSPPQTTLMLKLIDNDPCRSIITRQLPFNISFFKDYAEKGGIIINVGGKKVKYNKFK